MIAQTYCGKDFYAAGYTVPFVCAPEKDGYGDGACPSCLRAHIARLEAALAKERIVVAQITNVMEAQAAAQGAVPDPTDEEVDAYLWDRNHGLVDSDEDWVRWSRRVGRWAYALAVSRMPASRVLGEGQVAVDPMYLNALILVRGVLFEHMATDGGVPMTDALAGAMERIEAHEATLRTQPAEGGAT